MKTKANYWFEYRGKDRQTEWISECILKDFCMIYDTLTKVTNYLIFGNKENNIHPLLH